MLETERLLLRKLKHSDIDDIFAMRRDTEIMRFIREPQIKRAESLKWINMISSFWESENIGYCAVIEKESNKLVGWCGLWHLSGTDEIEVGYAIARNYWGKGYATEAAERCLQYGFKDLGLKKIAAVAFPENNASLKVMKKLRMKFVQTGIFYEKELVQYAITKEEYDGN